MILVHGVIFCTAEKDISVLFIKEKQRNMVRRGGKEMILLPKCNLCIHKSSCEQIASYEQISQLQFNPIVVIKDPKHISFKYLPSIPCGEYVIKNNLIYSVAIDTNECDVEINCDRFKPIYSDQYKGED